MDIGRKLKRTKREQLLDIENANRSVIEQLVNQDMQLATQFNGIIGQLVKFQKEILCIKNALKRRGIITELDVSQERSQIEELEKMEAQAVKIGGEEKKGG